MHRSGNISEGSENFAKSSVDWSGVRDVDEWLKTQPHEEWKKQFEENGYLVVDSMLNESELNIYRELYDRLLHGGIDASSHRHDLGNHEAQKTSMENICQIMWPSLFVSPLDQGPVHKRGLAVARIILGDDMSFDFDMLIAKPGLSDTPTPVHQDQSYWLDMPDKRATSCWVAMDETTLDNGCMWFGSGSHKSEVIRAHRPVKPGVHVLTCDGCEDELTPAPLKPGGATFHHGRTLHYSRGNTTDKCRRGFVVNFRPLAMVEYERANKFDHGKTGLDGIIDKGATHQKA